MTYWLYSHISLSFEDTVESKGKKPRELWIFVNSRIAGNLQETVIYVCERQTEVQLVWLGAFDQGTNGEGGGGGYMCYTHIYLLCVPIFYAVSRFSTSLVVRD